MTEDPTYKRVLEALVRRTHSHWLHRTEWSDWVSSTSIDLNARACYITDLLHNWDRNVESKVPHTTKLKWIEGIQQALDERRQDGTLNHPQTAESALGLYMYLGSSTSFSDHVPTFSQILEQVDGLEDDDKAKVLGVLIKEQDQWTIDRDIVASRLTSKFLQAIRVTGRTAFIGAYGGPYPLSLTSQCYILQAISFYSTRQLQGEQTIDLVLRSKLALYVAAGGDTGYGSELGLRALTFASYDAKLSLIPTPNLSIHVIRNHSGTLSPLYSVNYTTLSELRKADFRNFTLDSSFADTEGTGENSSSSLVFSGSGKGEAVATLQLHYMPLLPSTPRTVYQGLWIEKMIHCISTNGTRTEFQPFGQVLEVGDLIEVQLSLTTPDSVHDAVLEDFLPGGLEALDPNLDTGERISVAGEGLHTRRDWRWYFLGFSTLEVKRDRVTCAAALLSSGTHSCAYFARASSSGTFLLPGAHGYLRDQSEVGGSSAHSIFTVSARKS
jgi:hypothetical protein